MDKYAALLHDRPDDVDFTLFEPCRQLDFVKSYYAQFGELPSVAVFEHETGISLPDDYAPWKFYEEKLRDDKFVRDAIPILTKFNNEYEKDQKRAVLDLRDKLAYLTEPSDSAEPVSIVHDVTRYEHFKDVSNTRLPTGIQPLDEASGGLSKKDEFMIISARLGVGKSWIAHFIAASMCQAGYRVGIYSGEMSEDEVGARFDAIVSHISNYALTRGKDVDLAQHQQKLQEIEGDLLVITPTQLRHNATPSDLRRFVKAQRLDCLFIDQLSLMEPDGMRGGEEWERKSMLSLQLKTLQQELRIPVVAVNQLNRGAAQQEADASNLAGSDRIGQDATLIIALSRKEDTLKMKVLKARSFRLPEQPWEFTWDIDKGILEPKLSAMDAVRARIEQANARQAAHEAEERTIQNSTVTDEDELW